MEVANEPVRAIGPLLANKKGTEIGWVTSGLRHWKCPCSIPSSLLLWHPPKCPYIPDGTTVRRWCVCMYIYICMYICLCRFLVGAHGIFTCSMLTLSWCIWIFSCGMWNLVLQYPLEWECGVLATGPPGKSQEGGTSISLDTWVTEWNKGPCQPVLKHVAWARNIFLFY